jgi:hypothetical protein
MRPNAIYTLSVYAIHSEQALSGFVQEFRQLTVQLNGLGFRLSVFPAKWGIDKTELFDGDVDLCSWSCVVENQLVFL